GQVHTQYCYGFGSDIGAGPYDQSRDAPLPAQPTPVRTVTGGGVIAAADVAAVDPNGTLLITDSLTFKLPGDIGGVGGITNVLIQGMNGQRPVIRATGNARPKWTITGKSSDTTLVVQGVHLIGADLLLAGKFKSVEIRCATLDPGTAN